MVDWVDIWGSEEKGWAVHFVQCGEKLLNLVDSFQNFQKYPESKFVTAEAQVTRGWRASGGTDRYTTTSCISGQYLLARSNDATELLRFSQDWRSASNNQANVVSPRVIPCDHRDSGRELKIVV